MWSSFNDAFTILHWRFSVIYLDLHGPIMLSNHLATTVEKYVGTVWYRHPLLGVKERRIS